MSDGVDRFQQSRYPLALGHVSSRAGRLGDVYHAGAFMHRKQKYAYAGETFVNFPRCGEPVQHRHGDIQNHQIRFQLKSPG